MSCQLKHWQVSFITLFPEVYPGVCGVSILKKALDAGLWSFDIHDIRNYALMPHRQVDDTPYGGGPGMVLRADVLDAALAGCGDGEEDERPLLVMSAKGRRLQQSDIEKWSGEAGLRIVCGRFEGIDQRFIDKWNADEVSVGDVVLAGGEIPSMLITEACVRLLPGVVGAHQSLHEESYQGDGLLEYPHYTRPQNWQGYEVPSVLTGGHHGKIAQWRREKAEDQTQRVRPDIWQKYLEKKQIKEE